MPKSLLDTLKLPEELRYLKVSEQKRLSEEIKERIIKTVSQNGGHLASNLGVVELTVSLHCVFSSPTDNIIWDVGHQCYAHKLLTGRADRFSTIRTENGLSGFPKCEESEHDAFLSGHSSTSLSAALGLAYANRLNGRNGIVTAVIGDGAMTGGQFYEALNNAGKSGLPIIIVINDNGMSISKNVGAIAKYLSGIRNKPEYFSIKDTTGELLRNIPVAGDYLLAGSMKLKTVVKDVVYGSNIFEDMGFSYLGPVDGHDIKELLIVLRRAKALNCPVVVHVGTQKGNGYGYAEQNPKKYHAVSSFNIDIGANKPADSCFSLKMGEMLCTLASENKNVCAVTAAMKDSTGLSDFKYYYPERFFDVGIAEGHAVTFCGALAAGGMLPVFAVYSTFLQRGFDQLIHDCAIEPRHIVLAIDRAGVVGEDGETHQGLFDIPMLRMIPGATVYAPVNYNELNAFLHKAVNECNGIAAVRYPRGRENEQLCEYSGNDFDHIQKGGRTLIITYGRILGRVLAAADLLMQSGVGCDILKLGKVWPIEDEIIAVIKRYRHVLFVEEGMQSGGLSEWLISCATENGFRGKAEIVAVKDFVPHGDTERILDRIGFSAENIARRVKELNGVYAKAIKT